MEIDMTIPLKLAVIAGDRSGPFMQTYSIQFKFFQKYNLIDPMAVDFIATDLFKTSDIIEFQRQYASESVTVMKKLLAMGKVCIFHVDDNVWELPPNNPATSTYKPGSPILQRFELLMKMATAVTTSTPYLKKHCLRFNKNTHIYRNVMDPDIVSFLSPGRDNPDEIRIGWTGTPHHHDDILPMEPVFPELVKDSRVKLVFMGYAPPTVLRNIPRKRWEYYEFVPVDAFYPAFANLDFDIGIAPLVDNGFNKGKTARKAQEYAMCKIPMILAPVLCYTEWKHGETCIKATENTVEDWYKRIKSLMDHPKERERLSNNAYAQVIRNHDINVFIWERAATYYKIYKDTHGEEHPHSEYIRQGLRERNLEVDF